MPSKELNEAQANVERALKLLDSETADAIIGSAPDEYGVLIRGIQGIHTMLWMMALGNGMRKSQAALKMGAQALTIMLTLVHYAYALGIRHSGGTPGATQERE